MKNQNVNISISSNNSYWRLGLWEVKVGRHDPRPPHQHHPWPTPPFQSVIGMTSKNWSKSYKMIDIHPHTQWPLKIGPNDEPSKDFISGLLPAVTLIERGRGINLNLKLLVENLSDNCMCVCFRGEAVSRAGGGSWLLLLARRRLRSARLPTIGPYSLPPLAGHPPPPPRISWYQFIRRHCWEAGCGPFCWWRSGPRMGIGPGRAARNRSPLELASAPAQSSAHPAISNDPRRSPVECQRRQGREAEASGRATVICQPSWQLGKFVWNKELIEGAEGGDGEHAVSRSPEWSHGEFQSCENKQKSGEKFLQFTIYDWWLAIMQNTIRNLDKTYFNSHPVAFFAVTASVRSVFLCLISLAFP